MESDIVLSISIRVGGVNAQTTCAISMTVSTSRPESCSHRKSLVLTLESDIMVGTSRQKWIDSIVNMMTEEGRDSGLMSCVSDSL